MPPGALAGRASGSSRVSVSPRCVRSCTFTGTVVPGRRGSGASTQARVDVASRSSSSASTSTESFSTETFSKSLPTRRASGRGEDAGRLLRRLLGGHDVLHANLAPAGEREPRVDAQRRRAERALVPAEDREERHVPEERA